MGSNISEQKSASKTDALLGEAIKESENVLHREKEKGRMEYTSISDQKETAVTLVSEKKSNTDDSEQFESKTKIESKEKIFHSDSVNTDESICDVGKTKPESSTISEQKSASKTDAIIGEAIKESENVLHREKEKGRMEYTSISDQKETAVTL